MTPPPVRPEPVEGRTLFHRLRASTSSARTVLALGVTLSCTSLALAYEPRPITPVEVGKLPRTAEETTTLWDYLNERTEIGVGFDEIYEDNILLQDSNKQEDFLSIPEMQILFADPRGAILYGFTYEVNLYRYHRLDRNAIDHDLLAFFDYDPGGRYRIRANYDMDVDHRLIFGAEKIDITRRSSDFQRSVEHTGTLKQRYALNNTNALVQTASYSVYDDQVVSDAESDRRTFNAILDFDHDLKPGWTLFSGYQFTKTEIPGDKLKSSKTHGWRMGARYEATEIAELDSTFTVDRQKFKGGGQNTNLGFSGFWKYWAGPRTILKLGYTNAWGTSFLAGRSRYRSSRPTIDVTYELTPLVNWFGGAVYEKQKSGSEDVLPGTAATSTEGRRYSLNTGFDWQIRENSRLTLKGEYVRSKSSDYTDRILSLAFETNL